MPRFVFPQIIPEFLVFRQSLDQSQQLQLIAEKKVERLNPLTTSKKITKIVSGQQDLQKNGGIFGSTIHAGVIQLCC